MYINTGSSQELGISLTCIRYRNGHWDNRCAAGNIIQYACFSSQGGMYMED